MLFKIPLSLGAVIASITSIYMLFSNSYRKLERWIIAFVGIIGISFIFELALVKTSWFEVVKGWIVTSFPHGSTLIIMSVLGAVVMPHNLFLHSEIIQSRQWNLKSEKVIKKQLKYEFLDTLFSMIVGWGINSAMIIVATAVFFKNGITVTELPQAQATLKPLLGNAAAIIFALALIFAGLSSSITAAMASGSIFAGIFGEPFDIKDNHSRIGAFIAILLATIIIFFLKNSFKGLIVSQVVLSIQLPWTILGQILLTSSKKVMGKYKNTRLEATILWIIFSIVSLLNVLLLLNIGKS
jgi:manganese transport protein